MSEDVARVQSIVTVRLEWAMVDVAGGDPTEFKRLFDAVDRKRLVDPLRLAGQLRRGRRGSALVRARLTDYTAAILTESELEELFLTTIVRPAGLPEPIPQASPLPKRHQRVDFIWPDQRVAAELDSREWHAIQSQWGEDHERDVALRRAGFTPLRYTHRQVTQTPQVVADDLRAALTRGHMSHPG